MAEGDEDKTAFFAGEGVFCYRKIPFGLKNAGATYQRLVDKVFHDQIGRNLEAYIDDMVIKTSIESINAALFAKREEEQAPIYFVSKVLQGAEINYSGMKKLILALVHAARRLRRYFQAHMITVLTNSPIKQTLTKPEKLGLVAKWAIEIGEHNIVFQERGDETPKDFLIEVPLKDNKKEAEEKADTKPTKMELSCEWKLFTDGAASFDVFGAGLMLIDPEGKEYTCVIRFGFETTNNKAKFTIVGKSNKRYLRSQATNDQRILTEDQRGFEGLRQLHDRAYPKEPK
ncbi:reverse transcriptase domain-containing protein [Tanacetum coccineum]